MALSRSFIAKLSTIAAAALLVAACATPTRHVDFSESVEASAIIDAIDRPNRLVQLRGASNRTSVVHAGPGVANFDRLNVGDRVSVRFTDAIAADVVKPGMGVNQAPVYTAARNADGTPSGKMTAKGVVKIASVDTATNTVQFTGAGGVLRTMKVVDPKAIEFIRTLRQGDEVQLTFTEAVAVSITPVGK